MGIGGWGTSAYTTKRLRALILRRGRNRKPADNLGAGPIAEAHHNQSISRAYSLAFLLLCERTGKEVGHMLRRLGLPGLLRVAAIVSVGLSLFA